MPALGYTVLFRRAKRSMSHRIASIARYTVLESVRTRLPALVLVIVGVLLAGSFFVREIAITESARFQAVFYSATARYAAVITASLYTLASVSREFHDKGVEIALALDLPRSHYILGKLAGFVAFAAILAVAVSLPLAPMAGWEGAAQWAVSLAFELAVVVALSLFCVVTFNHVTPAFGAVLAFYVLARAITAIRLISASPISDATTVSHEFMGRLVEALAFVIPAMDGWTRTEWLVDRIAPWSGLLAIAGQSALFTAIFAAAAVFDLHRRNF